MNPCILEPITHSSYICLYKICCLPFPEILKPPSSHFCPWSSTLQPFCVLPVLPPFYLVNFYPIAIRSPVPLTLPLSFLSPPSLLPQSVPTQLMHINLCFQLIRLEWMLWLFTWQVGAASGLLKRFIIEPFVPHKQVDPVTHTSFVMISILVFLFTLCFRRLDELWLDRSLSLSMDF